MHGKLALEWKKFFEITLKKRLKSIKNDILAIEIDKKNPANGNRRVSN